MAKTDIGPLLARSAHARDGSAENARRSSRDDTTTYSRSRYTAPKEESPPRRYGRRTSAVQDEEPPRYGYTSRFLNKSKSSAAIPPDEEDHKYGSTLGDDSDSKYPSGRSRYMALKERRQRLARSRSSQQFGDEEDIDEPIPPTSSNPTAYLASRGYGSTTSSGHDLARSRSSHALKSRDNSPDRSSTTEKDGAALSSWARYLKNKYGNRNSGKDKDSSASSMTPSSSSSTTARRLSLGLPLRSSTELGSSDDDQKNMQGSPTTPPTAATAAAG
jgi:tripartite motif-containing protein 71